MERITAGLMGRTLGKKDMVFCIVYCDNATPYENYKYFLSNDKLKHKAKEEYPLVLAQHRWDGKYGFPGGNVELHHETLLDALKDELSEELNLHNIDESNLKLLSTFANEKRHITAYTYKVSYEEIKKIQLDSFGASDMYAETGGPILLQLHSVSIPNIMNSVFSGTGKEELQILIDEYFFDKTERVRKALKLAEKHFKSKLRNNGKNYFEDHILKVYNKVIELGGDEDTQIIAILHDMFEDTSYSEEEMINDFGVDITNSVKLLTMNKSVIGFDEGIAVANSKKCRRAYEVRFADRLSNLECTSSKENSEEFMTRLIKKTRAFYIPNFQGRQQELLLNELNRLENELENFGEEDDICSYCGGKLTHHLFTGAECENTHCEMNNHCC